ncbi:MAG: 5-formyltetrahydrofolate cyclo-ligase [Clostridiales bacterium]|nr:5-formyltetrahydrofolate cyclo-ligase [Clostridiales bacterium]
MDAQMILSEKQAQRKRGIQARNALSAQQRAEYSRRICEKIAGLEAFQRAETVLLYAAFRAEVSLDPLLLAAANKRLAWPVCLPECQMAAAVPQGPEGWETGAYGIRAPILERSLVVPPEELDLVLVPCTAFDPDCHRVGMGKGYYDRYLARCVRAVKLGVAFQCQQVERAAVEAHDLRLDGFITEREVYTWNR